ncbi:hypothetical protein D3C72_873450 [compost metagenome]
MALLFARLGNPILSRKLPALSGIVFAIQNKSEFVSKPLRWFLGQDAPTTSVMLVLEVLLYAESEPYPVTNTIVDLLEGYGHSEIWGHRELSRILLSRVGISLSDYQDSAQEEEEDPPEVEGFISLVKSKDAGRVERLAKIWSDFPLWLGQRLASLFMRSETNKERARSRYELAHGPNADEFPGTPVLKWDVELMETALHEVLNGLSANIHELEATDEKTSLLFEVLPRTAEHLGCLASRTVRPLYPSPQVATAGCGDIPTLDGQDPRFAGWRRLAYFERQRLGDALRRRGSPQIVVTIFSGAIAGPRDEMPPSIFPLPPGNPTDWWDPRPCLFSVLHYGPIVALKRLRTWLGDHPILIPPIQLRTALNLKTPDLNAPLEWRDEQGNPAVALRTWHVRNRNALHTESIEYEGVDLIVRPDAYDFLVEMYQCQFTEKTVINRNA